MEDLVSIVVPVYNVEKYLDRCVQSITGQTYSNIEVILVDDGSKDSSPVLCDKWCEKDSRVTVIHKQNEGAGFARNAGLDLARGKYILFVDSDDYIELTLIEKCLSKVKEHNSQVVLFGRNFVRDDVIKIDNKDLKNIVYLDQDVQEKVLSGFFNYEQGFGVSLWSKFFDLSIIKDNNIRFYSERDYLSEDALFILEYFSYVSNVVVLPEFLYFYNQRENSLSHNPDINRQQKNNRFLKQGLDIIKQKKYSKVVENHFKARYHIYAMSAIKDVYCSALSKKQKTHVMNEIFNDDLLHSTLSNDVLSLESFAMRFFYQTIKFRQYWLCRLILKLKY